MMAAMACAGLGVRVCQARDRAGLTQEIVARRSGISREWLIRIEAGRTQPKASHVVAIHGVLAERLRDLSLVWLMTGSPDSAGGRVDAGVNESRRRFMKAAAAVPAALALPLSVDVERLTSVAPLDADLLDGWESITESYARMRPSLPPRELLPQVEMHLASLRRRIRSDSPRDGVHRRLLSITSGSAALAAWISFMLERRREARDHLDTAEPMAREVGDHDTLALVLMLRADLLSSVPSGGAEGFPAAAQRHLDRALSLVSAETPLSIRAPLLLRSAEEHAYIGDGDAALGYLDKAAAAAASSGTRHHYLRPTWGRAPDVERIVTAFRGSVLQMVGRARDAIEVLSGASTSRFPADRPMALTDLAAAHAREGDLDRSCELLNGAVDLAIEHDLPVAARRISGVRRRQLVHWSDEPALLALDERLAAIL
jgi:transcriptional regulator with XRE-family HTH domain